jgi:predicted murein hydrolase (TIGR00659 family)
MEFLESRAFLLALTFGVFFVVRALQKRTGWVLLNPILLTILILIAFLEGTDISYDTYSQAGQYIEFWLKPAVVALGVPLYLQLDMIRKQWFPILVSQLAGCLAGILSVVIVAQWLGASPEVVCSLAPKSVTTPIAMEISSSTGGIPSLTAAVVVVVGLFGAVFGFQVLKLGHVTRPIAQGLSMGTATHAVGTSTAMQVSQKYGAYAGLGLTLNGILTALLTPGILRLLGLL